MLKEHTPKKKVVQLVENEDFVLTHNNKNIRPATLDEAF
jgi:hypothetical protein